MTLPIHKYIRQFNGLNSHSDHIYTIYLIYIILIYFQTKCLNYYYNLVSWLILKYTYIYVFKSKTTLVCLM